MAYMGLLRDIPIEEAKKQFEVNLFGLASLTQQVLPYMRKVKNGTIINTSSMGGKMYFPLGAWYISTKHAVEGFSDCLRLELKQFNINVVILEPGIIKTEFSDVMLDYLNKYSSKGAYATLTKKLVSATQKMYYTGKGSETDIIAKTILKIVNSKRPKTRYRVGFYAQTNGMVAYLSGR